MAFSPGNTKARLPVPRAGLCTRTRCPWPQRSWRGWWLPTGAARRKLSSQPSRSASGQVHAK
eukprot:scaffold87326_cov14-Prasinocladus_malaysianus.AAC.1